MEKERGRLRFDCWNALRRLSGKELDGFGSLGGKSSLDRPVLKIEKPVILAMVTHPQAHYGLRPHRLDIGVMAVPRVPLRIVKDDLVPAPKAVLKNRDGEVGHLREWGVLENLSEALGPGLPGLNP